DLTPWGGHKVQALPRLAAADRTANLIVAGGEVFTCNAFEAAVMVLPPDEAEAAAIRFERAPEGRMAWAQQVLGTDRLAPYAPGKSALRRPSRLIYNAVGGVDLPVVDAQLRAEVAAALEEADFVGVRDRATQQALAGMGIDSVLMPDGAALVAELFGER